MTHRITSGINCTHLLNVLKCRFKVFGDLCKIYHGNDKTLLFFITVLFTSVTLTFFESHYNLLCAFIYIFIFVLLQKSSLSAFPFNVCVCILINFIHTIVCTCMHENNMYLGKMKHF